MPSKFLKFKSFYEDYYSSLDSLSGMGQVNFPQTTSDIGSGDKVDAFDLMQILQPLAPIIINQEEKKRKKRRKKKKFRSIINKIQELRNKLLLK